MKFTAWDIIFMLLIGPLPPSFLKMEKLPEESPKDLEVPTTEIGTPIEVLFGKRRLTELHVVWYGDVRIVKVKVDAQGKK